jgi:hypothetical protein
LVDRIGYYSTSGDDDFRIDIIDPDTIYTYDICAGTPVIMNSNQKNIIGSVNINLKPDLNTLGLTLINRYSGYYNPIFKDILFYNNFVNDKGTSDLEDDEICPFSNTSFDDKYEDLYGKFGVINNMWFHKATDNKDIEIVNTLTPYYPLTGQYALDYRDYNIFEGNWDQNHYTRQLDVEHSEPCQNISSMKDGLCMFGSKYLNVPEIIEISGLTLGDDINWSGEWNDEWITNPDACPGEVMFKEVNDSNVNFYFFFKKRILRYFYEKLKDEFERYIQAGIESGKSNYSYGIEGVEDDIKEYVTKNILKLYKLEKVRVFVRRTKKGQHNSRIKNDYSRYITDVLIDDNGNKVIDPNTQNYIPLTSGYFKSHGFIEPKTITLSKINRDDFDRKIVYNLRNGCKEDFGFTFVLKKI